MNSKNKKNPPGEWGILATVVLLLYFIALGFPLTRAVLKDTALYSSSSTETKIMRKKLKAAISETREVRERLDNLSTMISILEKSSAHGADMPLKRFYSIARQAGVRVLSLEPAGGKNSYRVRLNCDFQAGISFLAQMETERVLEIMRMEISTRPFRYELNVRFPGPTKEKSVAGS